MDKGWRWHYSTQVQRGVVYKYAGKEPCQKCQAGVNWMQARHEEPDDASTDDRTQAAEPRGIDKLF